MQCSMLPVLQDTAARIGRVQPSATSSPNYPLTQAVTVTNYFFQAAVV